MGNPRGYTWTRRAVLSASVGVFVGVPTWHLVANAGSGALVGNALSNAASGLGLGSIDPVLVGAPWSVSVLGFEFMDPLAAIGVAAAGGWSLALLFAVLPSVLLLGLLGRFFCGWLCPYRPVLAASNAARGLLTRFGYKPRDVALPAYTPLLILGVLLVVAALTHSQIAALIHPPAVIGREVFKAVYLGAFGAGIGVLAAALMFDTFVSRAGFCRYFCPGGALFTLLSAFSFVSVRRDADECIDCGICDRVCNLGQQPATDIVGMGCERCGSCVESCPTDALTMAVAWRPALLVEVERARSEPQFSPSRRAWMLGAAGGVLAVLMLQRRTHPDRIRPPGAATPDEFDARCIRCFRCAEVCPVGAIVFDVWDLRGVETPWIDPARQPCILCMACTEVCPTGALQPVAATTAAIAADVRMGTAILDRERCIAWTGAGECSACWQVCPLPDRAVLLNGGLRGAPVIDAQACVGCGLCQQACPERANAIVIEPRGAA